MQKLKIFIILLLLGLLIGSYFYQKKPLISVVMSTYNRTSTNINYLSHAIESILNQTESNFEFIIINDGSTDETGQLLKEFSKKDPRIKVLTNKINKGLPYSLNKGLKIAKGKYIARMDDDDWSFPTRFQKQTAFLEKNKNIIATGCSFQKDFILPSDPEISKILTFWDVPVIHPCAMIRNDFLKKNKIQYPESFPNAEDMPFWFEITIKHNGAISNLSEVLLFKSGSSPKPTNYLKKQRNSVYKYRQYACNYFNKNKKDYKNGQECYRDLAKNNKVQKHLNIDKLKQFTNEYFPPENSIYVIHPQWTDYLILEGNKAFRRQKKTESASIIEKNDTFIKVKWDKYGIETFEKIGNDFYLK